jgi:hypothetical protein
LIALVPPQRLYYEDLIAMSYSGSTVQSIDNGIAKPFTDYPVINLAAGYPPQITSSAINKTGSVNNIIVLNFDRAITNTESQLQYFTITLNNEPVTVQSLTSTTNMISFKIKPYVKYGTDTVKVSYAGGNIASLNNGKLEDFTDYVITNNLAISAIDGNTKENMEIKIFPNPMKSEFTVSGIFLFNKIDICSIDGKLLEEYNFSSFIQSVNLKVNLKKGIYLIKVSNKDKSIYSKLLVE